MSQVPPRPEDTSWRRLATFYPSLNILSPQHKLAPMHRKRIGRHHDRVSGISSLLYPMNYPTLQRPAPIIQVTVEVNGGKLPTTEVETKLERSTSSVKSG